VFDENLVLPEGGLLLHVGPHKTGTTAVQSAFFQARAELAKLGVIYPLRGRQHQKAALALTGGTGLRGDRAARPQDWDNLVSQVHAHPAQRVFVSSEFFDECTDDMARRLVDAFDPQPVHVVVTLRPLARILPSAWQQYVRNGLRRSYDEFLEGMLCTAPYDRPTPSFWRRHRHDELVDRWARTVGAEQVVVVVVDEREPDRLIRTFERFFALPTGTLVAEAGWDNRSLTAAETELIRLVNNEYHARKWAPNIYNNVIRLGLIKQLQRRPPGSDEAGIVTPRWAVERANEIAAKAAARMRAAGVHIVGDLALLSSVPAQDPDVVTATMPVEAASQAVVGAIYGTAVLTRNPLAPPPATVQPSLAPAHTTVIGSYRGVVRRGLRSGLSVVTKAAFALGQRRRAPRLRADAEPVQAGELQRIYEDFEAAAQRVLSIGFEISRDHSRGRATNRRSARSLAYAVDAVRSAWSEPRRWIHPAAPTGPTPSTPPEPLREARQ
jgi:hypothetical protein